MKKFENLPSTNTPLIDTNLNQFENKLVVVSATEPTGDNKEKVWIKKSNNLCFKTIEGYSIESNGTFKTDSNFNVHIAKVEKDKTYSFDYNSNVFGYFYSEPNINSVTYNNSRTVTATNVNTFVAVITGYVAIRTTSTASKLMIIDGKTALPYEPYFEPSILTLSSNDSYEEIISKDNIEQYSTGEIRIGTWIDGKPLYRKVINFGALPNATTKNINHGISNIKDIVKVDGTANNGTNYFPLPYIYTTNSATLGLNIILYATKTNIIVITVTDRSAYTGYVTLEYTKTTD